MADEVDLQKFEKELRKGAKLPPAADDKNKTKEEIQVEIIRKSAGLDNEAK